MLSPLSPTLPTRTSDFDADLIGWSYGEIPPAPWDCPACGTATDAIGLTDEGLLCPRDFQAARAAGHDPQFFDAVLA